MPLMRLIILLLILLPGCGIRERERELEEKLRQVNEKEQQLLLKEKELQLREEALANQEEKRDSGSVSVNVIDTVAINPEFLGQWQVRMVCTETNCAGSAVGDVKSEHWTIEQQGNSVIARAMTGNELVRAYSGRFNGSFLVLSAEQPEQQAQGQSRITARLQRVNINQLEGKREISRPGECRIVYDLDLRRIEK